MTYNSSAQGGHGGHRPQVRFACLWLPFTGRTLRVACVNFDSMMPPDPFAGDPNDPASFLEADEPLPPLTDEDRERVREDLELVGEFRRALEPRGVLGVFFMCEDCDEQHYYDWDIMAANMRATLAGELSPVHEPSARPDPAAYVPWDYCLGFLDGMEAR